MEVLAFQMLSICKLKRTYKSLAEILFKRNVLSQQTPRRIGCPSYSVTAVSRGLATSKYENETFVLQKLLTVWKPFRVLDKNVAFGFTESANSRHSNNSSLDHLDPTRKIRL